MKKGIRVFVVLSVAIFFTVFFSAISCSIQPGPIAGTFSVTIINHHSWQTLHLFKNGSWFAEILGNSTFTNSGFIATDYIQIYNPSGPVWLHDASLDETWVVNSIYTFNYYGGAIIDVSIVLSPQKE